MSYSQKVEFFNPSNDELWTIKYDESNNYAKWTSNCSGGSETWAETIEEVIEDFRKWIGSEEFAELEKR